MAPAIMPMSNGGGRAATSCLVLLLLVLALQLRISSAVQDADGMLIKPVAKEQQRLINDDLEIAEEFVEEEARVGSTPMTATLQMGNLFMIGNDGRVFQGTVRDGQTGAAQLSGQGVLVFESPGMYADTSHFQITRFVAAVGNRQHVLFQNALGTTLGVWSGTFTALALPSGGEGRFIR